MHTQTHKYIYYLSKKKKCMNFVHIDLVTLFFMQGVAESIGDWYFDRVQVKAIDCAYPCDNTCHNLVFKWVQNYSMSPHVAFLFVMLQLPIVNKCNIHLSKWQIHACWGVQTIIASKFLLMDFGHDIYKWDSIVSVEGLSDSNFQKWCTLCTNPSVLLPTSTWNEI